MLCVSNPLMIPLFSLLWSNAVNCLLTHTHTNTHTNTDVTFSAVTGLWIIEIQKVYALIMDHIVWHKRCQLPLNAHYYSFMW